MDNMEMPVTLIVKAPNQQIGDQTIQCQLNWTVKRLKSHLSEVYPSKPRTEEQKLIYSGHLLHDSSTLKDVLRRYEGQDDGPSTHTLHLVCAASIPTQRAQSTNSRSASSTSSRSANSPGENPTRVPAVGEQVQENISNTPQNEENPSNSNPYSSNPNDGLRNRFQSSQARNGPEMGFTAGGGVLYNPWAAWAMQAADGMEHPMGIASTSQQHWQMQWMQQAYAQYLAQYMQLIQSGAAPQGFFVPTPFGTGMSPDGSGFNTTDNSAAGTPNFPPAANNNNNEPAVQDAGVVGPDEVDGMGADGLAGGQGQNRDWIDWIYYGSRLIVFLSIVYFYSTLARFLLVTGIGMAMYLWQVGFFRLQQPQVPNVQRGARDDNAGGNGRQNNNEAEQRDRPATEGTGDTVPPENDGSSSASANNEGSPRQEAQEQRPIEPLTDAINRQTVLGLTWTFFTSFFASLLPETPTAI